MNSQILTGTVAHGRSWPQKHNFAYPVYFFRFDLDELSSLDRTIPGFGYNRAALVRMDDNDFLMRGNQPLKEKVTELIGRIGYKDPIQRIELITFARYFNTIFRPLSFFACYDQANRCRLAFGEVHNTFGETHLYVLKEPTERSDALCFAINKDFHVSPFFDMEGRYGITFKDGGATLELSITLTRPEFGDKPIFFARLTGSGQPLTTRNLYHVLARYPFNALLHMPRIIRQAFALHFRKKLPVFTRPIPRSEFTMRKQSPSWLERKGIRLCFSFLAQQSAGRVVVTLPEGDRHEFGPTGTGLTADLHVKDYRFFSHLVTADEIGMGVTYEKGCWESSDLVRFIEFMFEATLSSPFLTPWYASLVKAFYMMWHLRNRNTPGQAKENISRHYDLGNEMYKTFLDETLTYSCAIFDREDEPLADAQLRKIDRILEKACLNEQHHLLEIGTGWGTLAMRAAKLYGCRVTSITLSEEQHKLAVERIARAGLSDRITVLMCDYRKVTGKYDRIISVEMLEAVGRSYFPAFFRACDHLLKPNGMLVIQTITVPDQQYEAHSRTTDWIRLFIFPGGHLPSLTALTAVMTDHTSLVVKDVESIGPHYALTLAKWRERFLANRDRVLALGFPETFIRRWEYYLSFCEAGFAQHYIDDLQIVITRPRNPDCIAAFDRKIARGNHPAGSTT